MKKYLLAKTISIFHFF